MNKEATEPGRGLAFGQAQTLSDGDHHAAAVALRHRLSLAEAGVGVSFLQRSTTDLLHPHGRMS